MPTAPRRTRRASPAPMARAMPGAFTIPRPRAVLQTLVVPGTVAVSRALLVPGTVAVSRAPAVRGASAVPPPRPALWTRRVRRTPVTPGARILAVPRARTVPGLLRILAMGAMSARARDGRERRGGRGRSEERRVGKGWSARGGPEQGNGEG